MTPMWLMDYLGYILLVNKNRSVMRTFVISFLLFLATASFAQNNSVADMKDATDTIGRHILWDPIEIQPRFKGDLNKWLEENLRFPPEFCCGLGRVIVQFMVKADGSITDAKVLRGVAPELDAEALRVVNSMPKWIPARENGKNVDFNYILPITFKAL